MNTKAATPPKQGTDVNQLLPENDIGAYISRNKVPLGAAIVVLLGVTFGYGYFTEARNNKYDKFANELNVYTEQAIKDIDQGKVKPSEIVSGFDKVYKGKESFASAGTMMAELSDALVKKGHNEDAYALVTMGIQTQTNKQVQHFLRLRAATLAEDLGKAKEALGHLEYIIKSGQMYMADKVYLDAGRLYFKEGNKEKARASFDWVIKEGTEAEFKKMANLYLGQM